jgi:spore germination cell wall hydrolase CwlJ-like protein
MIGLYSGPKGAPASFGLAALALVLLPTAVGPQDIAVRAAPAPASAAPERSRPGIASPFGTIHAATFTFPRPVGTDIPEPKIRLASLSGHDLDLTGTIGEGAVRSHREAPSQLPVAFPKVNRALKGDLLGPRPQPDPSVETETRTEQLPDKAIEDEIEAAARFTPFPEYDISMSLELHPHIPAEEPVDTSESEQPDISLLVAANDPNSGERTSRLYFGGNLLGSSLAGIVPWSPGEEPILMVPRAPDPDIKRSALAALPEADGPDAKGESIAGKGEVTGREGRPKSPAERLGLIGKTREKAEKCLANAVYFESRGESVRGQIAVAQVVLNRAFSGYYPDDVCGVVYQNAHRHLACQFTFACDGIPDVISEAEPWERAKRVAKATLDGKIWLPEIGKATHYHAYWVKPWWVRSMRNLSKIGVHSFYRPHRWGDGADAPSWGSAVATAEAAAQL